MSQLKLHSINKEGIILCRIMTCSKEYHMLLIRVFGSYKKIAIPEIL